VSKQGAHAHLEEAVQDRRVQGGVVGPQSRRQEIGVAQILEHHGDDNKRRYIEIRSKFSKYYRE
jgi:hypothetical protein